MSFTFELPDELKARVAALASDLGGFATQARDAFEERTEAWRDSTEGWAVDSFIDVLIDVADTLEFMKVKPE